jgi:hypothetical protein
MINQKRVHSALTGLDEALGYISCGDNVIFFPFKESENLLEPPRQRFKIHNTDNMKQTGEILCGCCLV